MACCAVILLVLVQLWAPFSGIWRRITGRRTPANAAVAWSPSEATSRPRTPALPSTRPRRLSGARVRRVMVAVAGIELLVAAGFATAFLAPTATARPQPALAATAVAVAAPADALALTPIGTREPDWYVDLHNAWCGTFDAAAAQTVLLLRGDVEVTRDDRHE